MKIKRHRPPLTPEQAMMRHLNRAYDQLGEARFILDTQVPRPAIREQVFRLLAGVIATCEIVKLGLRR